MIFTVQMLDGLSASGESIRITVANSLADGGGGGVSDHGALTGLGDDDHTQYHTDARGDARYWPLSTDLATQAELDAHAADTTSVHGIADTSVLATDAEVATAVSDHEAAANPHPTYLTQAEGDALYEDAGAAAAAQAAAEATAAAALTTHAADTTAVHGIADTSVLATDAEVAAAVAAHEADTTSVHGIADTSALETTTGSQAKVDAHTADATDAHDASAISFTPAGTIAATDVQAAIEEVASEAGGSSTLGVLGRATITASQSGISTTVTDITGLSVTITAASSRLIRVTVSVRFFFSAATQTGQLYINEGATDLHQTSFFASLNSAAYDATASVLLTPSAGSHTYKARAARFGGSGTLSISADPVAPCYILVEDLGPA
jgi:hypothetical protein